jgi:hypothetical protein
MIGMKIVSLHDPLHVGFALYRSYGQLNFKSQGNYQLHNDNR